jgi:FAD/FMN-containing dehydrogenase
MAELDRRTFLTKAAAGGLTLAAGAELAACADAAMQQPTAVLAAVKAACSKGPPIPNSIFRAVRGHVFGRSTPGFAGAAHVYNTVFDGVLPKYVARPINAADVRNAVRWAVKHDVPMRARSGGHSYAGYSVLANGLVIDLRRLDHVSVNRRTGIATVGAGAQLLNVYAALANAGATIPAGSCPSVGVGGHALGGGMGLAGRAFGLTLDNLVEIQIITADGCIRNVSKTVEPDLFWALRGAGGGNFGVVTQFKFKVHRLPRVATGFFISWPWSQASNALAAWQAWNASAPPQVSSVFHLETGPRVVLTGQYLGPASSVPGLVRTLTNVSGAQLSSSQQSYFAMQMRWAGCSQISFDACHTVGAWPGGTMPREAFRAGSDYINRPLSGAARATLVGAIENRQGQPGSGAILFDSYGGAINRVHPNATAFVHRNALFCIQYLTYNWGSAWLAETRAAMRPFVSGFCYQNYADPTLKNWQRAYYGSNYRRLVAVKREIDPHRVFEFPQAIGR